MKCTFVGLDWRQTVGTGWSEGLLCEVACLDEFDWERGIEGVRHGCWMQRRD